METFFATGSLEKEVNLDPIDFLDLEFGWENKSHVSPVSLDSLEKGEENHKVTIRVYLNEKGSQIIDYLSKFRDFSEDMESLNQKLQNALACLSAAGLVVDRTVSALLFTFSIILYPFTRLQLKGVIRGNPSLTIQCANCGHAESLDLISKTHYETMKNFCPSCFAMGDNVQTLLVN